MLRQSATEAGSSDGGAQPTFRPKILIVDDRPDLTDVISRLLANEGCEVVVANTAENLGAVLRALRPTALILDVMMPGRDGYDALQDVVSYNALMPVLLISGHGSTWLRMGESLSRINGLANLQTAAKPISRAQLSSFAWDVRALATQ